MGNIDVEENWKNFYWPSLPLGAWRDTYETLHMWTQIVGKMRLALCPLINHWWEVALYVTARGLTTSPIPYGLRSFQIHFDFIDHVLQATTSEGAKRSMALAPKSVADFYREIMEIMSSLDLNFKIDVNPKEVPGPIPFDRDQTHKTYDRDFANRHFRILVQAHRLMESFRSDFIGKCSPVHFFWGSFDLAVTRFSGRRAPPRTGADHITQEGYSHEVLSVGFWPGSGNVNGPAFYSYAAPEPPGFAMNTRIPSPAFYNPPSHGYVLMYDEVIKSRHPDSMILDFFQSTYDLGAQLGRWDRENLERHLSVGKQASR